MQIVIDIPEEVISTTWSQGYIIDEDNEILTEAIKSCKVLPKNHGRLIDANNLEKSLIGDNRQAFTKHQVWLMFSKYNKNVPTVLEAESEDE